MISYQPVLFPDQLRLVASGWRAAASLTAAKASAARSTIALLQGTGFDGFAANLAYKRLETYADNLEDSAARAERVAVTLEDAAEAQEQLNEKARQIMADRLYGLGTAAYEQLIIMLNLAARALDAQTAKRLGMEDDKFMDRLILRPHETLQQMHNRFMQMVDSTTREAIRDASRDGTEITVLEAGDGSTTVMVGETENPERIITIVSGVSSGNPDAMARDIQRAKEMAEATGASVIIWQGYDPPPALHDGGYSGISATKGADDLSLFQYAVNDRWPDADKSVVSHSYGTVVTSLAAKEHGLIADDVWFLGSPGVHGESVDDLQLVGDNPRVYTVDASDDPIKYTRSDNSSLHGQHSPSHEDYGAIIVDGVEGGHSAYWESERFLEVLADPPGQANENSLASAGAR